MIKGAARSGVRRTPLGQHPEAGALGAPDTTGGIARQVTRQRHLSCERGGSSLSIGQVFGDGCCSFAGLEGW